MEQLPIRSLTLYKQGIDIFERRGSIEGNSVSLALPRAVTNDVLKSLTVTVMNGGPLQSVEYSTPATTTQLLRPLPLTLGERSSLLDLLANIRGSTVSLQLLDETTVSGRLERRLWAVTMDTTEQRARVEWAYVTEEQYVLVSRINRALAIQIEHRDPQWRQL